MFEKNLFNLDNMWYFLGSLVLSLLMIFSTQYINQIFKYKQQNDRRNYFLEFLKSNKTINNCIKNFKKKTELGVYEFWFYSMIGLLSGYLMLILFPIILYFIKDSWLSVACLTLINFIPYILIIYFIKSSIKTPLKKTNSTLKKFVAIKLFIIFSNLVILFLIYYSYISPSNIETNFITTFSLFLISITLALGAIYGLINGKRIILESLMSSLNEKYYKNFPNICVKVKSEELCGKLQNIFDDKLVVPVFER